MKNITNTLLAILIVSSLAACKKDSAKTPAASTASTQTPSESQMLAGKWYVVKDSVQTLDLHTVISNVAPAAHFSTGDFITFNNDNTATVSSLSAFNAIYPNYVSSNVTSSISVSPVVNPDLNFRYQITAIASGNTAVPSDYDLSMQNSNPIVSAGFRISSLSSTNMVLYHQVNLPTIQHAYVVNEYVYLQR